MKDHSNLNQQPTGILIWVSALYYMLIDIHPGTDRLLQIFYHIDVLRKFPIAKARCSVPDL